MNRNRNLTPPEADEQATLFSWAAMRTGKYPELKLLYHVANGGLRSKSEAARFKSEGVKPGVPDICLPVARGPYHGLYIELKRQKGGKISEAQKKWLTELSLQGYLAMVAYGWKEASQIIEEYLDAKGV